MQVAWASRSTALAMLNTRVSAVLFAEFREGPLGARLFAEAHESLSSGACVSGTR